MRPAHFIQRHRVFRMEDFIRACYPQGSRRTRAAERALEYHVASGGLIRIRRGLYLSTATLRDERHDSFLIAAKAAPDAVLAYHTALEFHGIAHTLRTDRIALTSTKAQGFLHDGTQYRFVSFPVALNTPHKRLFNTEEHQVTGTAVTVTAIERTLVDLLDRPDLAGGWEELWRSAQSVGFVDPDIMIRHVRHLSNATTAARVGWFLEQHRERWMIGEETLRRLERLAPASPRYLLRTRRQSGRLLARWNLIVPGEVAERRWEEVL